jgi:hypothetical protein
VRGGHGEGEAHNCTVASLHKIVKSLRVRLAQGVSCHVQQKIDLYPLALTFACASGGYATSAPLKIVCAVS